MDANAEAKGTQRNQYSYQNKKLRVFFFPNIIFFGSALEFIEHTSIEHLIFKTALLIYIIHIYNPPNKSIQWFLVCSLSCATITTVMEH